MWNVRVFRDLNNLLRHLNSVNREKNGWIIRAVKELVDNGFMRFAKCSGHLVKNKSLNPLFKERFPSKIVLLFSKADKISKVHVFLWMTVCRLRVTVKSSGTSALLATVRISKSECKGDCFEHLSY